MMVPFRLSQLFGIVIKIHGMAIASEAGIQLAFHETQDQPQNPLDANVKSVSIPWDNLEAMECRRGIVSDQVLLRVKSTDGLVKLPGVKDQELALEVSKNDRDALKAFAEAAAEYRAGQRHDKVDAMLDDVRDFLHGL